jgi:hypothetical protein
VVIDQLFPHIEAERRKLMTENIYMQWDMRRERYDSSKIFSPDHRLNGNYVAPDLALTISALCGEMMNDNLTQAITGLVIQECEHMQLDSALETVRLGLANK